MRMPRAGTDEMGNCATRLRPGLQCPENAVFFKSLGYDDSYVWGNSLDMDDEMETMCVFEAPENEALFQHARDPHEGLPASSLFVRAVLTVGNYDYTQTFKVKEDGEFEWYKELSGYAVGAYVLPGEESSKKMADLFGSMISESSYGALHTHSAVTKVDLDIAGTANSFKKKYAIHSTLLPLPAPLHLRIDPALQPFTGYAAGTRLSATSRSCSRPPASTPLASSPSRPPRTTSKPRRSPTRASGTTMAT
jgi:hypothetical protein